MKKLFTSAWMLVILGLLSACSDSGTDTEVRDNSDEVAAFYAANPEKFPSRRWLTCRPTWSGKMAWISPRSDRPKPKRVERYMTIYRISREP